LNLGQNRWKSLIEQSVISRKLPEPLRATLNSSQNWRGYLELNLYLNLVAADRASVSTFLGQEGVELFLAQKQEGVDPF